jgi:shikimate dehydrogenase
VTLRPGRLVLLGHPVAHSLSPTFQNAALRSAGIPLTYELLDVPPDALRATLAALVRQRAAGNATVPYKAAVAASCGRLTPQAHVVGAVNAFWTHDGVLHGDNTDVAGFDAAAAALLGTRPTGHRVALLGAGGGAAAVLAAVERWPDSEVRVYARRAGQAEALAARFRRAAPAGRLADALAGATLVVNATPVGLRPGELPTSVVELPAGAAVVDLVYRRGETDWVRAARAAGHPAADGLRMLVEQGALAFERWFGVPPNREAMWAAIA